MKKPFLFLTVLALVASSAALLMGAGDLPARTAVSVPREIALYAEALNFVRNQHVRATDPRDLVYASIAGMLGHLDPYSAFLTPDEYAELKIGIEGHFVGVGVEVAVRDGVIAVVAPIEGAPAWEAGVLSGDEIVSIDGVPVKDFSLGEVVRRLRGRAGTQVRIEVWRDRDKALHAFTLKRVDVTIQDIRDLKIVAPGIGYLKIVEFQEKTPQNLDAALEELRRLGAQRLIIDLRNNPGGLLERAVEATQRFLKKGAPIVTVGGRDPRKKETFISKWAAPDVTTPLVFLVNEGSASGSEIMAGALRQHERATLVGTRTFGKGCVQTIQPLSDGSALMLTTANYVMPNGISLEENGIVPDVVVEDALPGAGSDPPLDRAVDLLKNTKGPQTS